MSDREEIAKMYASWMEREEFHRSAMNSPMVFWAINSNAHPADLVSSLATALAETQQKLTEALLKAQYPT